MSVRDGLFRGGSNTLRDQELRWNSEDRKSSLIKNRSIENRQSAMLHLFTPVVKEDPIIRPFRFNVDPIFMDDLTSTIKDVKHDASRSVSGIARDRFFLKGKESADRALMPSDNSYIFGRSNLNNQWQFVLEVNNAPIRGRHHTSNVKNKIIYTGYFIDDEPVSKRGVLNPEATMVFTHLTQIDINDEIDRGGYRNMIRPRLDLDILHPVMNDMDGVGRDERKYLLSPNQVLDVIDDGDDEDFDGGYDISNPSLATLDLKQRGVTEISMYNSPRQQLNRIVTGLAKTVLDQDDHSSGIRSGNSTIPLLRSRYDIRKTFRNYIGGDHIDRTSGPEYRKQISVQQLLKMYPSLDENLQIIDISDSAFDYNTLDEGQNDLLSIMSSYLKNAIPSVFADHGISDITFRYATSDPRQIFINRNDRDPIIDVHDCQPVLNEPFEDTQTRCRMALNHLQEFVFSVVENICDDIEVLVDFKLGQDTLVQLQLRDHTEEINEEYVIHQGNLGGIISPQLGGIDEFENHNSALTDMINIVDSGISQDRSFL